VDSDPKPGPPDGLILLVINLAAYAAFIIFSLPTRQKYREIFDQMGTKSLPGPAELILLFPDLVYAVLISLVPAFLLVLQVLPVEPRVKTKGNIAALAGLLLLLGFFTLALHMPLVQTQRALGR